jgi:hypothetical protein
MAIYKMDFGKKDTFEPNLDRWRQKIVGFLFLLALVVIYNLIW